jgi:hypothetical protein
MAVVAMALPAPAIVSASASLMVYATLVVVMPGSVHRLLWPHLGPRLRRFRADETGQP